MSLATHEVANRVRRLADTLTTLRQRVREAVAGETGRAVGDAVRELLAAALDGRLSAPRYHSVENDWDDDRTWRDDVRRVPTSPVARDDDDLAPPARRRWPTILAFAVKASHSWATRRLPTWAVLVLGAVAGTTAWIGGHLAHSVLALFAAVADLFPPVDPISFFDRL